MDRRLVIGLGNPGVEYAATRHNAGWMVLDELARRAGVAFRHDATCEALCAEVAFRGRTAILAKPLTYMNLSGMAVAALARAGGMGPGDILVVVDDLALPLGKLRFRGGGSSGGHNGLKSIAECLETDAYARLRFGIGGPQADTIDHVLSPFGEAEWPLVTDTICRAGDGVFDWLEQGLTFCQNRYNSEPRRETPSADGPSDDTGKQREEPVQEENES